MTMITPSYLGETIEYSSLHACRSTLEDPTGRANVPDTVVGHPEVVLNLRILPGGEVFDISIIKPSGNPTYDAAIERAARSASPLPVPPADSELFSSFRNLTLNIKHDR